MSSASRPHPYHPSSRNPFKGSSQPTSKEVENNLEKLGLLGGSGSHKSKRKAVEFQASAADQSRSVPFLAYGSTALQNLAMLLTSRCADRLVPSRASSQASQSHRSSQYSQGSDPRKETPRARSGMAGVLDLDRSRTRKDRTFIGSECAVCEEHLEYTLKGERILQLSCGHVAHEACFYEYLREFESQYCPTCSSPLGLDSSRGGNVLDIEKITKLTRQPPIPEMNDYGARDRQSNQSATPWDNRQSVDQQRGSYETGPISRENSVRSPVPRDALIGVPPPRTSSRLGTERDTQHTRNNSGTTGMASLSEFAESQAPPRRHDYDVQSVETTLSNPQASSKGIPTPSVTVKSEFPTITRSRQQQALTCLVTVEVPAGQFRLRISDPRPVPSRAVEPMDEYGAMRPPPVKPMARSIRYSEQRMEELTSDLQSKVDNWHGLDFSRFGKLKLHSQIRVGKDRRSWQDLDCYLFDEMLICVKERKPLATPLYDNASDSRKSKCTLKGSILIKKHLREVEVYPEENLLTLSLSVAELPSFHLQFSNSVDLEYWKQALHEINPPRGSGRAGEYEQEASGTDEEDERVAKGYRYSSQTSAYGAAKSYTTAPTEYSRPVQDTRMSQHMHVPLDIVLVIPVSSSMQGLKISLLRDALKFLVTSLGDRDRMGLVTFGSSGGGVPVVSMTSKSWDGWSRVLESIRPVGQKSLRADVVEGANVAMDLLMQRKSANAISSIMLISDSSTSDAESVDFVVQRAEAAKVTIHAFGLGLTHKPDTMIELSTRTKASYTYVKDWMMLRECVAGCLGSLQTTSHQNAKLKLRLPEGSPAKFVKISGALHITKRASGRDAEAALGDLRFGDKRDILVQLAIQADNASSEQLPQDPWETILSGLEALGGPLDQEEHRNLSVEEVPLIQADLTFGDLQRDGAQAQLPRPSLLAITMLPSSQRAKSMIRPLTPPIPPHPSIVQRRMELLTSDMLTRALTLVSRGQHERAHHLLSETRSILKGLGKGGLPPLPPPGSSTPSLPQPSRSPGLSSINGDKSLDKPTEKNLDKASATPTSPDVPDRKGNSSPPQSSERRELLKASSSVDARTVSALDAELESSLEWINHPAVFSRDSRKAVLQAIGVISSQRGYTFRTPAESLWAERIEGIRSLAEKSRDWREVGDDGALTEES